MNLTPAYGGSGGGLTPEEQSAMQHIRYDADLNRLVTDVSLEIPPSTLYFGTDFSMSNGVQCVGFRLTDGSEGLGIVNRFNADGTLGNPSFYNLSQRLKLTVNDVSDDTMPDPLNVQYTTAGDNLTYSYDIIPATAGVLKIEYWLGTTDQGKPVTALEVIIEETDIGRIKTVNGNFMVIAGGTDIYVRFSGVQLKGSTANGLPYFISNIQHYKEVGLIDHVETVKSSADITIGCKYAVDATKTGVFPSLSVPVNEGFNLMTVLNDGSVVAVYGNNDIKVYDKDGYVVKDLTYAGFISSISANDSFIVILDPLNNAIAVFDYEFNLVSSKFAPPSHKAIGFNYNTELCVVDDSTGDYIYRYSFSSAGDIGNQVGSLRFTGGVPSGTNTFGVKDGVHYFYSSSQNAQKTFTSSGFVIFSGSVSSPYSFPVVNPNNVPYVYNSDTKKVEARDFYDVNYTAVSQASADSIQNVVLKVPAGFTDTFEVFDTSGSFVNNAGIDVDFSSNGQGIVYMRRENDNLRFWYNKDTSKWFCKDLKNDTYTQEV